MFLFIICFNSLIKSYEWSWFSANLRSFRPRRFILNSIRAHSVDENPVKTEDFFLHRNRFTQDGLYMFQPQRPTNGAAKKKKLSAASRSRNLFKLALIPQVLDTFFSKIFLKNLKIIELREFIALKFNA